MERDRKPYEPFPGAGRFATWREKGASRPAGRADGRRWSAPAAAEGPIDQAGPGQETGPARGAGDSSRDDALGVYFRQMGAIPRLTARQEQELTQRLERLRRRYRRAVLCNWGVLGKVVRTLEHARAGELILDRAVDAAPTRGLGLEQIRGRLPGHLAELRRLLEESREEYRRLHEAGLPEGDGPRRREHRSRLRQAVRLSEELSPRIELVNGWAGELEHQAARVQGLARGVDAGKADRTGELRATLLRYACGPEELAALARVVQTRRARYQQARRELAQANLRLVVSVAKHFRNCGVPFADLIQEGNSGLMHAIDKYDPGLGFRFATYATWWVRERIQRALADYARVVRIPVSQVRTLAAIERARGELKTREGREPTREEIAAALQIAPEEVHSLHQAARPAVSLDRPLDADGEDRLQAVVAEGAEEDPGQALDHDLLKERMAEVLRGLAPRDREVLELRFGLRDGRPRSLDEVAQVFGVTRERIRQIEARGLLKLRQPGRRDRLVGFTDLTG